MNISGINTVEGEAMKSIRFSIPGQPMGKQRPRVVHNGSFSQAFTPKETVSYENLVRAMYREAARGKRFTDEDIYDCGAGIWKTAENTSDLDAH